MPDLFEKVKKMEHYFRATYLNYLSNLELKIF